MSDEPSNRMQAGGPAASGRPGDVPDHIARRYFTDRQSGPGLGFYVDASTPKAAFHDAGRRLSTERNDPQVVRDLVAIARHRDWSVIEVRGAPGFRRETWLAARAAGLVVRGYRPTERDQQALERRRDRRGRETSPPARDGSGSAPRADLSDPGPRSRLRIIEAVVRDRLSDPQAQAQILAAARGRLADWLERGGRFEPLRPLHRDGRARERRR